MSADNTSAADERNTRREQQGQQLRQKEAELARLASQGKEKEFFQQITPLLGPLKDYIKRRLRVAYLEMEVRTPVYTTGDLLDQVTFRAYEDFERKPKDLSLEQWLYRLANQVVDSYIKKRRSTEARRRSLETLEQDERRELEEMPFTADAEGEPYLVEDLDDSEYHLGDFLPVRSTGYFEEDPEKQLEQEEEVQRIVQILCRLPEEEQMVFELSAIEGFSNDQVAKIAGVRPDEVPKIVEKVKAEVRRQLESQGEQRKAS